MGLDIKNAGTGAAIGSSIAGPVGGIIGGGLGLISGIFGGGGKSEAQKEAEQRAAEKKSWEYAKEGMGIQYQLNEQAADKQQERNKEMWDYTNYENQRKHLENAGLSVGLMYGNGGGMAASAAGGQQQGVSAPTVDPVGKALEKEALGLQFEQIKSQNMLNYSQANKNNAEAAKINGVETEEAKSRITLNTMSEKLMSSEIEINAANVTKLIAEGQTAMAEMNIMWNNADISNETKEAEIKKKIGESYQTITAGMLNISNIQRNEKLNELTQKEIDNFMFDVITRRMNAEAAKENAKSMLKKIDNEYEQNGIHLNNEQERLRQEWIFGWCDTISNTIGHAIDMVGTFTKVGQLRKLANEALKFPQPTPKK